MNFLLLRIRDARVVWVGVEEVQQGLVSRLVEVVNTIASSEEVG